MSKTIAVKNLHAGTILADVTLSVAPGEVLAVVGSEGSGKTTLIKVLAGQVVPTEGSAFVCGVDCRLPEARRVIGVAGDSWGLMPKLTVWENMLLFARLWGAATARINELLKTFDLLTLVGVRAEKLRPGEAARLRLARALLHDAPVLLLDEPIGDIDRESASLIRFAISELAERGKTLLIMTFGHPKTLELATRFAYLEGGRLALPPELAPAPDAPQPEPGAEPPSAKEGSPIRHIAARKGERLLLFPPDEIRYAYAQEKVVYIHTNDGPCSVSFTLTELEDRLADQGFFRCHRGFLVNVGWVKEIAAWTRDSYSLILKDGKEIPLSKHRAQELRSRLGW